MTGRKWEIKGVSNCSTSLKTFSSFLSFIPFVILAICIYCNRSKQCAFSFVLFCTEVSLIQYAEKSIVHTEQMRISFVRYIKVIDFRGKYLHFMLRWCCGLIWGLDYFYFLFVKTLTIKYKISTHRKIGTVCNCKYETNTYIQTCILIGNVHSEHHGKKIL